MKGRYSLMGLTVAQVEAVSALVERPSDRWEEVDRWVVLASIYSVVDGVPIAEAKALTIGQLVDRINDGTDGEDPTLASG